MLIGLHAPNAVVFTGTDFAAIRTARIQMLKVMDFTRTDVLQRVRDENPGLQFLVRLYDDRISGNHTHPTPEQFAAKFIPRIQELRVFTNLFEIHNEPNHYAGYEGWGPTDADAADFREWYLRVLALLRSAASWARFGFPGLALNYPHRDLEWLDICRPAILASDWLGCHTYWQYDNMMSPDWGLRFRAYRARFPDKPIHITEFGNSTPNLPRDEMAQQYAAYYKELKKYPYIVSASSFICSSPDPQWRLFFWCEPSLGILHPVVAAVGAIPHDAPAPPPSWGVTYISHTTPGSIEAGTTAQVHLGIRNTGNTVWRATGDHPVRLGYHWYQADKTPTDGWDDLRTALSRDVLPGETIDVDASLAAPKNPGSYIVEWDMVEEGVAWFAWRGVPTLSVPVTVIQRLPREPSSWTASASPYPDDAPKAIDGDPTTWWSTIQPQRPPAWFQIDLGGVVLAERLILDNGPNPHYPRGYVVMASDDGETWGEVIRAPSNWRPVNISLGPRRLRYLRIELTRGSSWYPWTIREAQVILAPAMTATASHNAAEAGYAVDGDPTTRWTSRVLQQPGMWFQVDLGADFLVSRITLDTAGSPMDFPRGYIMRGSLDGETWQQVAARSPNWSAVDVELVTPIRLRYLRIELTRMARWSPWSIHDIRITGTRP